MPDPLPPLILIVDDEDAARYAVAQVLQKAGYAVWQSGSAADALRLAAEGPDLLIVNAALPDASGVEVCRRLKADPATAEIPLILAADPDIADGLAAEADGVLSRPVRPPELVTMVRVLLKLRQAEHAARENGDRFRQITETIRQVFWISDVRERRLLHVSPAYAEIWGRSCQSLYEQPNSWREAIHPDDRERVEAALAQRQRQGFYQAQFRIIRPDGATRWIWDRSFVVRDALGQAVRLVGLAEDVTENKRLAEQFRQAQKMEAIGRLAGGMAHDFNNLLTAILGYSELIVLDAPDPDADVARNADEIRRAADRGSALTRQLLAYTRQQTLAPRVLNLNTVVADMDKMLRRLITAVISLELRLDPHLRRIAADPGQIEQVLMNLAVNACDAMPQGGTLTIATSNTELDEAYAWAQSDVQPGAYALLEVSDTGSGMTEEVRAHLFEPFFTTKEVGKGTGLGLSTVYGIVKQSGGHIEVESAPGKGAKFKIYLPQVMEAARPTPKPCDQGRAPRGTETILLVEDEPVVRRMTATVLQRQGYRVLEAGHGVEALEVLEEHTGPVHLLLTDVLMPQMNGRDLAQELTRRRPATRVLFMSGYTGLLTEALETPGNGAGFLHKPFAPDALAREVRSQLDKR